MRTKPRASPPTAEAASSVLRYDWSRSEVAAIYRLALPELVYRAQSAHREFHPPDRVQTCQLISIKTGGCPEDCAYCPQSAHYEAGVEAEKLMVAAAVVAEAQGAKRGGAGRLRA